MLLCVLKPKKADLAGGLGFFSPGFGALIQFINTIDPVHKVKVNIAGFHFSKGSIQKLCHAFGAAGVGFGYQKNPATIFRIFFEIFADAFFTASLIAIRRIPVSYAPFHGLFHQHLIGGDIEHTAQ